MTEQWTDRYLQAFERLNRDNLGDLVALVAEDVHFVDPFNDCHGREAFRRVFEHMFETVENPVFVVNYRLCDEARSIAHWTFTFSLRGQSARITGLSELTFGPDGLLTAHIDHWDAAGQLYERLPLVGGLLRLLRRRLSAC
tara:strand:+ start:408 stop:830 length:423 start_codon:yes stop_codon:yes gene_type:complete